MKLKAYDIQYTFRSPTEAWVSFRTDDVNALDGAKFDKEGYVAEIKVPSKKRSLSANAYAWTLMDKLAASLGTTAVDVYKEIIQRVGVFEYVLVTKAAANDYITRWSLNGEGWIAVSVAERENGIVVKQFYGSSTYTVEEMKRLIDEIVSECKEQGIETATPDELAEMMSKMEKQ